MIRRFIPKVTYLSEVSESVVQRVQNWMNRLPRKILNYATPEECFLEELTELKLVTQVS